MSAFGWFLGAVVVALTGVIAIGDPRFDGGYRVLQLGLFLAAILAGAWRHRRGRGSALEWMAALAWILAAALALGHPFSIAVAALAVGVAGGSALLQSVFTQSRPK